MIFPLTTRPKQKLPGVVGRGEYLIDGYRVSFLHQADWSCACREFSEDSLCRHTREARGMREAQALIQRRMRELRTSR
jgi:hypothetical protein